MTHLWDQLEGVSLAGEYDLRQWLGSDQTGAFFLTSFGAERRQAVLKLVPEDSSATEHQLEWWQRTAHLMRAHVLPLLESGRTDLASGPYLYAVFEYPDDNVASALERGPLTEEEARDVMVAVVEGLRHIHNAGMVHTSIDAKHIVAVGDRILLASDTLRTVDDGEAARVRDVRALGALVYELLTTRSLSPGAAPELPDVGEPLRSIMRLCSEVEGDGSHTLNEIAGALDLPRNLEQNLPQPVVVETVVATNGHTPAATVKTPKIEIPPPVPTVPPERTMAIPLLLPAVAAVVVAVVLAATHKSPTELPLPEIPAPPPPVVVHQAPRTVPAVASVPAPPVRTGDWRVITYTFSTYRDAAKKAHTINTKWPALRAEIFTPKGQTHGPFLIAIGGRMTRAEASSLRQKATGQGLPHDTYIQNYSN